MAGWTMTSRLAALATAMAVGALTSTATVAAGRAALSVLGTAKTKLRAVAGVSDFATAGALGVRSGVDGALDDVLVVEDGGQRGAHEEGKGCKCGEMHDEG
jgi:hypothetical protein